MYVTPRDSRFAPHFNRHQLKWGKRKINDYSLNYTIQLYEQLYGRKQGFIIILDNLLRIYLHMT